MADIRFRSDVVVSLVQAVGDDATMSRAAWVLVLLTTSLGALWERWVYTGLLDFSTDYRTTSLFWEMNVGGASLDGALALSLPFALLWAMRERRPLRFLGALAVLLLAFYASLTTFSRGVYLAVPLGMALSAGGARWGAIPTVAGWSVGRPR